MNNVLHMCPECGKPTVDVSSLSNTAMCRSCTWAGKEEDLLALPTPGADPEALMNQFLSDFRNKITPAVATDLGRILVKYGFLTADELTPKTLLPYVKAAVNSMVVAVIKVRDQQETGGKSDRAVH